MGDQEQVVSGSESEELSLSDENTRRSSESSCSTRAKSKKCYGDPMWELSQKKAREDDDGSTDESDLEDFYPESRSPRYSIVDLGLYTDTYTISQSQNRKGSRLAGREQEPMSQVDDDALSNVTEDDIVEVNLADYKGIMEEEILLRDHDDTLLTSYQCQVKSSHSLDDDVKITINNETDEEVSEEEEPFNSKLAQTRSPIRVKKANVGWQDIAKHDMDGEISTDPETDEASCGSEKGTSSCNNEEDGDQTCDSEVDVSMNDYYMIRHQTASKEHGLNDLIQRLNELDSSVNLAEHNDNSDTEDEEFHACQEEVRHLQGLADISAATDGFNERKCVANRSKLVESLFLEVPDIDRRNSNESVEETFNCSEQDFMTAKEFMSAFRNDYDLQTSSDPMTVIQSSAPKKPEVKIEGEVESESESQLLSDESICDKDPNLQTLNDDFSDSVSLDDFYQDMMSQPHISQTIRMIEMDGVNGTVGVLSPNEEYPPDDVFGVRFLPLTVGRGDNTEEISNVSDVMAGFSDELAEGALDSPATEDESVSDLEQDNFSNPHYSKGSKSYPAAAIKSHQLLTNKANTLSLKKPDPDDKLGAVGGGDEPTVEEQEKGMSLLAPPQKCKKKRRRRSGRGLKQQQQQQQQQQ